jgi:glycosyltransferase involved in cell wall biosynthesis
MKLLIFVDWFLPGYKAGGQISSCSNIVYALRDKMDIYIITRDRDMDDSAAYPGVVADTWNKLEPGLAINYVSPGNNSFGNFAKLIREVSPDTIYFNSMFSYRFTLLPLLVVKTMKQVNKIVLAPRGMLHDGALQFKPAKKKAVLALLYYTGMLNKLVFHATDETEMKDIQKNITGAPHIQLVHDFPEMKQAPYSGIEKEAGYLKCLFVSRIVKKKNLLYLLQVMAETVRNISLTVVGPVEDSSYWEACLEQIKRLPPNCSVEYKGAIPNNLLPEVYRSHHLFVLPTLGENFGHVIFDAFINGRPVVISDQTPWHQLQERKSGFDISLADKKGFTGALDYFANMNELEFNTWTTGAWLLGKEHIDQAKELQDQYQSLFS